MIGITSLGVHIPVYRLRRDTIANGWGTRSLGGERTVAGYDEDSLTMAVNAAHDCMRQSDSQVNGLFFTSTSSPYKEKQVGATIATALDLPNKSYTADITGSRRGATIAITLAMALVKSSPVKNVVVTASDCLLGRPQSELEQRFGDAAAAVMLGDSNPIMNIVDSYSVFDEFSEQWRLEGDTFVRSWEERFTLTEGYMRVVSHAISEFLNGHALSAKDFSKVVLCGPYPRGQTRLAKSLGFDSTVQLQDPLFDSLGNPGNSAPLLMLAAALEKAKPGDKILLANYGDGSDLFILEVTENIGNFRPRPMIESQLARKIYINYEKYLSWRDLLPVEFPRRPDSQMPSVSCRWRERKRILPLYGIRCRQCGVIQYPPQRVCIECGAKDDFDDYKLSDKKARIFTFATDRLTPTKAPTAVNAVLEFEAGGRMICELTDCDPAEVRIGTPVEMTFRKLRQFPEIYDYFWKARPIERQNQYYKEGT
jgi:hydroxymethylglutaryl-CoA synthase